MNLPHVLPRVTKIVEDWKIEDPCVFHGVPTQKKR